MISFLAGKPNASTFPFDSIDIKLKPTPDATESVTLQVSGSDLTEALQYSATAGLPRLVKWVEELQQTVHRRGSGSDEGWRVSIASGSQDCIVKVRLWCSNSIHSLIDLRRHFKSLRTPAIQFL